MKPVCSYGSQNAMRTLPEPAYGHPEPLPVRDTCGVR